MSRRYCGRVGAAFDMSDGPCPECGNREHREVTTCAAFVECRGCGDDAHHGGHPCALPPGHGGPHDYAPPATPPEPAAPATEPDEAERWVAEHGPRMVLGDHRDVAASLATLLRAAERRPAQRDAPVRAASVAERHDDERIADAVCKALELLVRGEEHGGGGPG